MENNEAFEAEAALEVRERVQRSKRRGNGTVKLTNGGSGSRKENDYDDTPLLSREVDHDYGSSSEALEDGDGRAPPEWSGERDFEGKPWWNKPSVCSATWMLMNKSLTRSSGFLAVTTFPSIHPRMGGNRHPPA